MGKQQTLPQGEKWRFKGRFVCLAAATLRSLMFAAVFALEAEQEEVWDQQHDGVCKYLRSKWSGHICKMSFSLLFSLTWEQNPQSLIPVVMFQCVWCGVSDLSNTFWFTCLSKQEPHWISSVRPSDMLLLDLAPPSLILGCAYFHGVLPPAGYPNRVLA